MENTIENHKKFRAQYILQDVLISPTQTRHKLDFFLLSDHHLQDGSYLELNSLANISDEDAIEVAKIFTDNQHETECFKITRSGQHHNPTYISVSYKDSRNENKSAFQIYLDRNVIYASENYSNKWELVMSYLRSKSYLIGFNGLYVEPILEYGWAKYKENKTQETPVIKSVCQMCEKPKKLKSEHLCEECFDSLPY